MKLHKIKQKTHLLKDGLTIPIKFSEENIFGTPLF